MPERATGEREQNEGNENGLGELVRRLGAIPEGEDRKLDISIGGVSAQVKVTWSEDNHKTVTVKSRTGLPPEFPLTNPDDLPTVRRELQDEFELSEQEVRDMEVNTPPEPEELSEVLVATLRAELDARNRTIAELSAQLETLQSERDQLTAAAENVVNLEAEIEALQQEISDLREKYERELDTLKQELIEAKSQLADYQELDIDRLRSRLAELETFTFLRLVEDVSPEDTTPPTSDGVTVGKKNGVMRQRFYSPLYQQTLSTSAEGSNGNAEAIRKARKTIDDLALLFAWDYDPNDTRSEKTWSGKPRPTDLGPDEWIARAKAMNIDVRGFKIELVGVPLQGIRPNMSADEISIATRATVTRISIKMNLQARIRAVGKEGAVAEARALTGMFGSISREGGNEFLDVVKGKLNSGGIEAKRVRFELESSGGDSGETLAIIDLPTMKDTLLTGELKFSGVLDKDA